MMTESETKTPGTTTRTSKETGDLPRAAGKPECASAAERRARIAESANMKTKRRGLQGYNEQDWLEAEAEFDALPALPLRDRSGSIGELPLQFDW